MSVTGYTKDGADAAIAAAVEGIPDPDLSGYATATDLSTGLAGKVNTSTYTSGLAAKADVSALTAHTGSTSNPHSVTKSQVGLGNVDNTSDAAKPVSTAQQTALDAKAARVETVNTVAATGSTETLPDGTTATIHALTLDANCTLTFPSAAAGKSFTLQLTQDATGSRTVAWPASAKWAAGTAPTLSTGAGKKDVLVFLCIDGSTWFGAVAGLDVR